MLRKAGKEKKSNKKIDFEFSMRNTQILVVCAIISILVVSVQLVEQKDEAANIWSSEESGMNEEYDQNCKEEEKGEKGKKAEAE